MAAVTVPAQNAAMFNRRLNVVSHNVQHWKQPRKTQLLNMYREMNADIYLLQSHGMPADRPLKIAGYTVYSRNRSGEANDGVAIAVRRNLRHEVLDNFDQEFMAVRVFTSTGPVLLATCYLPPRRDFLPFPDIMRLANYNQPMYVMGDFNARHRVLGIPGENTVGRSLNGLILDGYLEHLGPPFKTFTGHQGSGTPDLILTNRRTHHCHRITPGPANAADHLPMVVDISCSAIHLPAPNRYVYSKADWPAYTAAVAADTPDLQLDGQPVAAIDAAVDQWYDALLAAKNRCIPRSNTRPMPHPRRSQLLQTLQVALNASWEDGVRNGWTPDTYRNHKRLQRDLMAESRRLYDEHWGLLLTEMTAKHPTQRLWYQELRRLSGRTKTSPYLLHQDEKVSDEAQREQLLSAYWADVWRISDEEEARFDQGYEQALRAQFPRMEEQLAFLPRVDLGQLGNADLTTSPSSVEELVKDLKSMRTGKAPGHLGVTKDDLVPLPPAAIANLVTIHNACFAAGYWPAKWKHAVVTFIPKKEEPHLVSSQRPISLLEIPGKLLEKAINRRLSEHLEMGDYLALSQYGFRQGRGTGMALALLWERCAHAVSQVYSCNLLCRDISKAFDKLWHDGIRLRLLQMDVPIPIARLISQFLRGRTASVRVGGHIGPPIPLLSGVPQGSCLSPTLYISYTADSPEPQPPSKLSSYADDNINQHIEPSGNAIRLAVRTIRSTAAHDTYEEERKISTNHGKNRLLSVARSAPAPVVVGGRPYPYVEEVKALGLRLTRCGFAPQVRHNRGKAYGTLNALRRFRTIPWRHKLQLYKSLIRPVLEYPAVPLHTACDAPMARLQAVQNSSICWITGLRFNDPDRPTMRELHGMLKLEPMNVRLHRLARRTWERLEDSGDPCYDEVLHYSQMPMIRIPTFGADLRRWWPSSMSYAMGPPPAPIYHQ